MKSMKTMFLGLLLCCQLGAAHAQSATSTVPSDTAIATRQALLFADSLIKANFYQNWKMYTDLTCFSAVKYYGGPEGFREHIVSMYYRNEPVLEEKPETLQLVTLMNDMDQWQCVIEKKRQTYVQDRKATVLTYLVGQSTDNGLTWKFVDVNHNSIQNLIYIMPAVFSTMAIPDKKILYDDELAQQAEEAARPKPVTKKKPVARKGK